VEAELKDEHQRKDQFLALLAHELRNPLAPLGNAVQIFPAVQHDPVQAAELVAIMQRQVKQMSRLIDDLLDLARITQGRIVLRREKTLVSSITAAAVEAVQPWIQERDHQLTVTLPSEELWIDADAARLSQILTNLLQNAAKYTEPGGQISLTVERAEQQILFRVQDNGPGLSPAMLTRIFDLFMQVEQTLNRAHGGLGIGLTLVRTLVELHGGSITAHSDGLGHGSTFVVRLPLTEDPANDAANITKSIESAAETVPTMHVLVVDDVQASAKTLAMMLTVLGQNVEIALDGPAAIAAASAGTFDLAFLDIAMPGMDGLEVATRLRSNPDLEKLVLVALTGFGQDDDRQRSFAAGFNEHLIKPTSIELLREVLQRTAQQKGLA
jgi:CheY-like chemotaxis protein